MYCRWESGLHPRESLSELSRASRDHITSLQDHIRLLQRLLSQPGEKGEESLDNPRTCEPKEDSLENQNSLSPSSWDPLTYNKTFIDQVNNQIQIQINMTAAFLER